MAIKRPVTSPRQHSRYPDPPVPDPAQAEADQLRKKTDEAGTAPMPATPKSQQLPPYPLRRLNEKDDPTKVRP